MFAFRPYVIVFNIVTHTLFAEKGFLYMRLETPSPSDQNDTLVCLLHLCTVKMQCLFKYLCIPSLHSLFKIQLLQIFFKVFTSNSTPMAQWKVIMKSLRVIGVNLSQTIGSAFYWTKVVLDNNLFINGIIMWIKCFRCVIRISKQWLFNNEVQNISSKLDSKFYHISL